MYDNIGRKIKNLAKACGWICLIGGGLWTIFVLVMERSFVELEELLPGLGAILLFLLSWPLYGFGELIEKVGSIEKQLNFQGHNGQDSYKRDVVNPPQTMKASPKTNLNTKKEDLKSTQDDLTEDDLSTDERKAIDIAFKDAGIKDDDNLGTIMVDHDNSQYYVHFKSEKGTFNYTIDLRRQKIISAELEPN